MQPPNSLIAFGVSVVVAASAIGVSPAAAEPGMRHRQSPARRETTEPNDAATLGQRPSEAQQRLENRFDRLQNENQLQQRLNQSQFRTYDRTLTPEPSPLQMEQMIQQQISLPDTQNPAADTSPSGTLDRLQFEQRVRQRLRPSEPQSPQSAISSAAETATETETPAASRPETPSETAAATPNQSQNQPQNQVQNQPEATESAKPEPKPTAERSSDSPADGQASQPEGQTQPSQTDAEASASSSEPTTAEPTESEQAESEQAKPEQAESEQADQTTANQATEVAAPSEPAAESVEANDTPTPEAKPANRDRPRRRRARRQPRVQSETAQSEPSESETAQPETVPSEPPADTTPPAADSLPTIPFDPNPADERNGSDASTADDDLLSADDEPAPEYLDPNPNPLAFPTQPEEVELVGTQPITLEQAVELAIRNNPELRQAQLQLERSQADLRERQALNLPTLDATTSFNQSGTESVGRTPEQTQVNPTTGETVTTGGELVRQYQDSTVLGAGLELNYSIFTSGRTPALIQAARSQVRLQQLEIERQTEQLILETAGDYYDLQQAGAQVNIFSANLAQAEQSLRDAQALERAGVGTRFDVLQAEVDVANARQRLTQQLSDLEVARRQLAQRLNISQTVNVSAADPIEVAGVWELSLEESIVQAFKNRVELEQQLIQREIAQQNRRAALAQLGPQVRFQGTFSVNNDLDTNAFLDSFGYNYGLALQASLSLFDGGVARAQANQEESNIAIAESEFENVQNQIRLDVERGFSQLNASFTNIQTTALAVEQAAEALRLARLRFQAGVGTQTDVLRQQSVLAEAQVNNLTAILDYNRALAVLQRAISNYPEGFLNDQP